MCVPPSRPNARARTRTHACTFVSLLCGHTNTRSCVRQQRSLARYTASNAARACASARTERCGEGGVMLCLHSTSGTPRRRTLLSRALSLTYVVCTSELARERVAVRQAKQLYSCNSPRHAGLAHTRRRRTPYAAAGLCLCVCWWVMLTYT